MSWLDQSAARMIRRAARRAPGPLQERLEEEWLADCAQRRGALSRLRLAIGCYWATHLIAREHAVGALAPAGGARSLAAYLQQDFLFLSRRTPVLAIIIGAHVLVFLALTAGLVPKVIVGHTPRTTGEVIIPQPQTPVEPREAPPPPKFASWPVHVPEPEPLPPTDASQPDDHTLDLTIGPQQAQLPQPPSPPKLTRIIGGPGDAFPNAEEFYPPAARRLGETGAAVVSVCVNALGQLAGAPTLAQSSGSLKLDGGALRLAKAGSGHYRATTENGQAVSSCFPIRIKFQLR
jgi:TonB family protein